MFFVCLFASILGNIVSYFLLDMYNKKLRPILAINKSVRNYYNSSNTRSERSIFDKSDFNI